MAEQGGDREHQLLPGKISKEQLDFSLTSVKIYFQRHLVWPSPSDPEK